MDQINITKLIARSGICSRRDAKRKIDTGKVSVNGQIIVKPTLKVNETDEIMVDGRLLSARERTRIWVYYKPTGIITTNYDPEGRPTVFSEIPKSIGRVVSVGRLDINSEGLLLLTNDGELARYLELPQNAFTRVYKVRVFGKIDPKQLADLSRGCVVDGIRYGKILVDVLELGKSNSWISVTLNEGKNREIRKVLEAHGLQVNRLIRVEYGPYKLENLLLGQVKEVGVLKDYENHIGGA